jgi:hypothetical protein
MKDNGKNFIFDMEYPPTPEVMALPWTKEEIERILIDGLSLSINFTQEELFKTKIWYGLISRTSYDKLSNGDYDNTLRSICEEKRKGFSTELSHLLQEIQFEIHNNRFSPTDPNDKRIMEINFKWILISNLTEVIEKISSGTRVTEKTRLRGMDEW